MSLKRVLLRRDTAINWTTYNPILFQGELGIEFDTKKLKIGDGINNWTALEYLSLSLNVNDPDLIEKIEDVIGTKIIAGTNTSIVYDDINGTTTVNAIGDVVKTDNLSGLSNYAIARTNLGLGNVDNTTDANKPISTLTQTALDGKQTTLVSGTNIKTINGITVLGSGDLIISGGGGDITVGTITATAGQTEITVGTYVIGNNKLFIEVNGLGQNITTDYTETTTTSITFTSGLIASDIVKYKIFS